MTEPDIVERLRTEHDRFARVPRENKFWLGPLVHARLAALFSEAANQIEESCKERDDARLEIWENHPRMTLGAREYADARGWAPFMEDNHNA